MKGLDTVESLSVGAARESVKFGGWLQLFATIPGKTALIYSIVTIYLGRLGSISVENVEI